MLSVSRITDVWVGICCCHIEFSPPCIDMTGIIISGSPNSISSGLGSARATDITIGSCGHTGIIVTGSGKNFTNNLGKATVGSQVTGCNIGVVVTGSPSHSTG